MSRARTLEVISSGPLATVQDLGRFGYAAVGVSPSGAADLGAHGLANRLVANPDWAATLEVTFGGLRVRASGDLTIALTGARAPATVDGRPVGYAAPVAVSAGGELVLGAPPAGLRTYLAVRGGLAVAPVLGSRATDTLSGIGPPVVREGDVLPVGSPGEALPQVDVAPVPPPSGETLVLETLPGPRWAWLEAPSLWSEWRWTVSSRSDRIGVRLEGDRLFRTAAYGHRELPSEGVVRGAVQLPPRGEPVVFLADHPVTGGYPVVAVLTEGACDSLAQARPGQGIRFRWRQGRAAP